MAETREVVITIKGTGSTGSSGGGKGKTIINNITNNNVTNVINNSSGTSAEYDSGGLDVGSSVLANQVFDTLKKTISTEAKYQINKYFSTRDDYVGQRNLNVALTKVNMIVGLGTSVAAGFMVGGPVGAVIGGVSSIVTTAVGAFNTLDAQNLKVDQMNAQLAFTRQRSGYSLTSGSVGDNK